MIPLFNSVGLIGLGLIGGSLARAIKKHNLTKNIIGYAKSNESLNKALELGIIDEVANSLSDMAAKCDIIIICTPLSTYENIAKELAGSLKKSCIISDVGSLKIHTIESFSKHLLPEQLQYLVPAHPIAGTEKTGVESGFAELYEGKKTILTPLPKTSKDAINKVSNLWEACGSNIVIIEAILHDKIYAEVSHLPQFLAYCYAELLRIHESEIDFLALKNDDAFWRFSRICASDPTIWIDIFTLNQENLFTAVDKFVDNFLNNITNKHVSENSLHKELTKNLPGEISQTLINCSPNANEYGGSGFKDFGSYKSENAIISKKTTNALLEIIMNLQSLLKGNSSEALRFMSDASRNYYNIRKETI